MNAWFNQLRRMFVRRFCFYDSAAMNLKKYGGRPSSAVFGLLLMKTKKIQLPAR